MSTKNYDSSHLTKRKQARVLGGYAIAISQANNNEAGPTTVRTTQPTYQSAVIVTEQNLGKCYCGVDNSANPYSYSVKGVGTCGCN